VVASEFVASSVTTHGISEVAAALMQRANPDVLHMRSDQRGYAFVEVTPEAARCDFRGTPFPVQPDASLVSQARVVVEAGRAGVMYGS
jgi:alkaline phosphatase D